MRAEVGQEVKESVRLVRVERKNSTEHGRTDWGPNNFSFLNQ